MFIKMRFLGQYFLQFTCEHNIAFKLLNKNVRSSIFLCGIEIHTNKFNYIKIKDV